jgi:transglutaminase-like putative cysteine protease
MARFIVLLPMLVAAFALGSAAHAEYLGVMLAVIASTLALIGPQWELDLGRQLVTSAVAGGTGYALLALLGDALATASGATLGEVWARFAAAVLLAAAARLLMIEPRGGRLATTSLVFVSLVASGESASASYAVFVVLFLATSLVALNASDALSASKLSARRVAVGSAVLLVAATLGLGMTVGIRLAYAWLTTRAHTTAYAWQPRVGFSDQMDLGALDGLLDSDRVVLRVRGPRVDYLRGVSLDTYEGGRWVQSTDAEPSARASYDGSLVSTQTVEVAAVSEHTNRFFLPLASASLVTRPSAVSVDTLGSVRPETKTGFLVARFVHGARDRASVAPPRGADLGVPRRLRPQLQALAAEWTRGASTVTEKLDAIERQLLMGYRYSRMFRRPARADPLLDFLFFEKRGHCEYFATAFALVARTAGIPARVVMGYRVGEKSPFGYYLVRDRNAHAWIEAWVPGQGWTTRDATPEAALPQNREHEAGYAASSLDALLIGYDRSTAWLASLSVRETSIAWLAGFCVLVWIVARGARRRRAAQQPVPNDEAALPFLEVLLSRLTKAGHTRRNAEPLERLAARVPDREAAGLLERYSALRYGGVGDSDELSRAIDAHAKPERSPRPDAG